MNEKCRLELPTGCFYYLNFWKILGSKSDRHQKSRMNMAARARFDDGSMPLTIINPRVFGLNLSPYWGGFEASFVTSSTDKSTAFATSEML